MELLIFANPISANFLTNVITKEWTEFLRSDSRKSYDPYTDKGKNKKVKNKIGINIIPVSNEVDYNNLSFEKNQKPDFVIIVPELGWNGESDFEGYQIAIDLIEKKLSGHYFNLKFISVLEKKELLKCTNPQHHNLIKAIPHYCLLTGNIKDIFFEQYTSVHFSLIKSLVISNSGRLNNIEHDLSGIRANFEKIPGEADFADVKNRIQIQLDELSMLQAWSTSQISSIKREVSNSKSKPALRQKIASIQEIIEEIKSYQKPGNDNKWFKSKSNYSVLIIEDEIEHRKFFCETFAGIYNNVYPSPEQVNAFDILKAPEIIEKESGNFNIIILDLLYKDKVGNWLLFNGLDLYQLVRKNNPYACVRIITSLPRDIVSKAVDVLINIEIPIGHIFTKKIGFVALKHVIYDRVSEINIECQENERRKKMFKPIPIKGIFEGATVSNLVLDLLANRNESLEEILNQTEALFSLFKNGDLNIRTPKWNKGELPSTKMKNKITASFLINKLPSIFTHRLIVIDFALKDKDAIVWSEEYENKVLNKKVCKSGTFAKGYLTSRLGFGASLVSKDEREGYDIEFRNLFSHEIAFISKKLRKPDKIEQLKSHRELHDWFVKILLNKDTFQNWDKLNINYNPYKHGNNKNSGGVDTEISADKIITQLTFDNLSQFLQSLIDNFSDPGIEKILEMAIESYTINESKVKLPMDIAFKIDQIFEA